MGWSHSQRSRNNRAFSDCRAPENGQGRTRTVWRRGVMADPNPAKGGLPAAANAAACLPGKGVNDPAHPCAAPKPGPKAPPPQVSPSITAQAVVVVKKKHTSPARVPVILRTDHKFTGKGKFTAAPADTI